MGMVCCGEVLSSDGAAAAVAGGEFDAGYQGDLGEEWEYIYTSRLVPHAPPPLTSSSPDFLRRTNVVSPLNSIPTSIHILSAGRTLIFMSAHQDSFHGSKTNNIYPMAYSYLHGM